MPTRYIPGEILPPLLRDIEAVPTANAALASNEDLNVVATWLDGRFVIPGTRIRFGLDAIIGLIPGIGDAIVRRMRVCCRFQLQK